MINSTTKAAAHHQLTADNLHGIIHLGDEDIEFLIKRATGYQASLLNGDNVEKSLSGHNILSLFFEDSTRTRTSFEIAAKRLGAEWINIDLSTSSLKKGETLTDTIQTLYAIVKPSAIVTRHNENGFSELVSEHVSCPVINAGDGNNEHPTQALLDLLTIKSRFQSLDGLKIAICGDIAHSRVANSNIHLLSRNGIKLNIIAPESLMPEAEYPYDLSYFTNMDDGLQGVNGIMMLRIQKERMKSTDLPNMDEYYRHFGLTYERLSNASPNAFVMHPGPVNRNIEIESSLVDDPDRSLVLEQVENGVPTRMAVLDMFIHKTLSVTQS
jgi:aspartate carbamoyltransferase catalytic subunit